MAFKPNVRDPRNSPAADVIAQLAERGAEVDYHDPYVARFRDSSGQTRDGRPLPELLAAADVVVVVTPHTSLDWAAHLPGRPRRRHDEQLQGRIRAERPGAAPGSRLGSPRLNGAVTTRPPLARARSGPARRDAVA